MALLNTSNFAAFGFLTLSGVTFSGLYESWKHYNDLKQVKKFPNYIPPAVEEGGTIASPEAHTNSIPPPAQDGYYYIRGKLTTNRPIRVGSSKSKNERDGGDGDGDGDGDGRDDNNDNGDCDGDEDEDEDDGNNNDDEEKGYSSPFELPAAASMASPPPPSFALSLSPSASLSSSLLDPLYDFAICRYELYRVLDDEEPSEPKSEQQQQQHVHHHPHPHQGLSEPQEVVHFDNPIEGDIIEDEDDEDDNKKKKKKNKALLAKKNKLSPSIIKGYNKYPNPSKSPSPFQTQIQLQTQYQNQYLSRSKNRELILKTHNEYTPLYIQNIDVNEFKSYIPLSTVCVKYSKTPYLKDSGVDTDMTSLVNTIEKELRKWIGKRERTSLYDSNSSNNVDGMQNLNEHEKALLMGVGMSQSKKSDVRVSSDSVERGDGVIGAGGYEHEWKGIKNGELWTVIGVWDGYNKIEPKPGLYCGISKLTIEELKLEKKREIIKHAIAGVCFVCIGTTIFVWRWNNPV